MRIALALAASIALMLEGCANAPNSAAPSEPDTQVQLLQNRSRITGLEQENLRLQQEVDRLARELGDANANVKAMRAQQEAAAAQATATNTTEPASPRERDGKASVKAQPQTPSSRGTSDGTVYTGPRGGRYTITPSGNKRYLPRGR